MRQRYSAEVRKDQLLDAALAVATNVGYQAVTRAQVAEKLGVSGTLVQYHFKTMPQFRRALMRHAVAKRHLPVVAQGLACGDEQAAKAPADLRRAAADAMAAPGGV